MWFVYCISLQRNKRKDFMKKLFLSIGLMIMSLCVMAQTESSHLTFRGIPIDGNINAFVSKLEAKGYEKKKSIENGYIMEGSFMGRTCELYVFCSPTSRLATKVTAYYPKDNSWSSIKSDYEACKEQYTKKYGKPTDTFEFFMDPYYEGDGFELQAIRLEKAVYCSFWKSSEGIILLKISEYEQISISYEDAQNIEVMGNERDAKIQDEI